MENKLLVSIISIVILLVVAGCFWFISSRNYTVVSPVQTKNSVQYVNNKYGFEVFLPPDWQGYSIINGTWSGDSVLPNGQVQTNTVQGPMISIRYPLWTQQKPYQDIPIIIFTMQQWNDMQQDKFHIGAAPVNPSELGRNSTYVFGLPARYNFAFPAGYQEVDQIIQSKPLQTFEPTSGTTSAVHMDSITPTSGPISTQVTISGSGFIAENTVLFDNLVSVKNVRLSSLTNGHQTLQFTVPSVLTANCKAGEACPMFARQVIQGIYSVSVENSNGASNALNFAVTGRGKTTFVTRKIGIRN